MATCGLDDDCNNSLTSNGKRPGFLRWGIHAQIALAVFGGAIEPSMSIEPVVSVWSPQIDRNRVDFPDPFAPSIATCSPGAISNAVDSTATTRP